MAITTESLSSLVPRRAAAGDVAAERPILSARENLITCALATWMLSGIYLDGWAHRNRDLHDSIVTPWHGLFYAGYIAFATWTLWVVLRRLREGYRGLEAVPVGYGIGAIGVLTFMVGGLGDQVWHLTLGVEQDLNAFQSPTHWLLAIGMFLMSSSPLRAGWTVPGPTAPRMKEFAPTLWSLVLTAAMFFFAFNYMSYFIGESPTIKAEQFRSTLGANVSDLFAFSLNERLRILGLLMISFTSIALVATILFAQRRWKLPFGSVTAVFVATALADNVIFEFRFGWVVLAALVGGLVADAYIQRYDPRPSNLTAWRLFPLAVLVPMWLAYYLVLATVYEMNWPPEMWTGSIVMSVLHCTLLTFLMVPLQNPVAGGDR
jgi:hypothetical protein